MLSPNFASLWPAASQPAAYYRPRRAESHGLHDRRRFNTAYCNNVLARTPKAATTNRSTARPPAAIDGRGAQAICTAAKRTGVDDLHRRLPGLAGIGRGAFIKACATDSGRHHRRADPC